MTRLLRQNIPLQHFVPPPNSVVVYPKDVYSRYAARRWDGNFIDTTGTTSAGINEALNKVGAGGVVYLCDGTYQAQQVSIPSNGRSIIGSALPLGAGTFIEQVGAASGTDFFITDTSSGAQEGAILKNLCIQGQTNGGHLLHIEQMKGGYFENLFLVQPGQDKACLRIRNNSNKLKFQNIRFAGGNSNTGIKCIWVGDSGDGESPLTTNIWFENCYSKALGASSRITGNVIHLDHSSGCVFKDCKFEGVQAASASCLIDEARFHLFQNVGFETPSSTAVDWKLNGCDWIWFQDCVVSNEPTAGLQCIGATHIQWRGGLIDKSLDIDNNSRWCEFLDFFYKTNYSLTFSGAGVEVARSTTRIRGMEYNSSNVVQAGWKSSDTCDRFIFYLDGTAQGAANAQIPTPNGGFNAYSAPYDGQVVAIQVESSSPQSAGTLTAKAKIDGVVSSALQATLDGSNQSIKQTYNYNISNNTFSRLENLEVVYDSAGTWETAAGFASTNLRVTLYVYRGGRTE